VYFVDQRQSHTLSSCPNFC